MGDGAKSALDATTGSGAKALSAVQSLLATDTVATAVNAVVAAAVKGPATAFDKALDANYLDPVLRPALGGSYHCLFDGSHTVAGAFAAVRDDSVDAPIVEEALGTVHALLKDASTPRGLPLATWDKETFDAVASSLDSTFGIPKRWFYELNTYDTADLLGASVGVVSVVFCWNRADTEAFSQLAASMGLSAAVAVNPLLLVVSVVAFARAFHKARDGGHADLVDGAFKGVVTTGATLATVSVVGSVGGPAVALPAGIVAGVIASAATKNVSLSAVGRFAAAKAAEMLPHAVAAPRDRAEEPTTGSQTSAAAAATTE